MRQIIKISTVLELMVALNIFFGDVLLRIFKNTICSIFLWTVMQNNTKQRQIHVSQWAHGHFQEPHFTVFHDNCNHCLCCESSNPYVLINLIKIKLDRTLRKASKYASAPPLIFTPTRSPDDAQKPQINQFQSKGHHEANPQSTNKMPGNPKFDPLH